MRKPIASDRFYEGNPEKLKEQLEGFIKKDRNSNAKIAIVPHAGYIYGGQCMGDTYSELIGDCDTVIIIGPNHANRNPTVNISFQSLLTPLGRINTDLDLSTHILSQSKVFGLDAEENERAHEKEHSLEVQLPFIQTLFPNAKVIPILIGDLSFEEALKLSRIIYYAARNKNIKIIISSDFSHYGEIYDFTPFTENIKENLHNLDLEAIKFILDSESASFYRYAKEHTTICCIAGIVIAIELAKLFSCPIVKKTAFISSADFSNDYSASVNYCGIIFKEEPQPR
ncbi:AmmeMemoRadiSam system protein B [Candidatus Pacearchaeota archaeon]|nr:AmmeMemoRadiSam system protein B [Candidatus Pacearchaeota archaeon]